MDDWMMWMAACAALVIVELFTGTFYILMIAIGLAAGALAAFGQMKGPAQILIAAVVGVVATGLLHRSRFGAPSRRNAATDPNVNLDIGQRVDVGVWAEGKARVMYRGAPWDVELAPGATAQAGSYRIVEVLGSRLIVTNVTNT
ncbi:MAG: NfeD family protein [Gammaproteobacteria bacterium]